MNNKQLQNKANLNHLEECKVRRKLIKKLFKRRKFQYWYLADSGSFFCYYADALNITVELTTPNCMTDYLPSYTYYDTLIFNINAYNRCFYDLAKRGEIVAAYPLVRLVADNFKIMVAEYLYPDKILPKIIGEGKELNQIRVKGEKLKDSDVNKAISELFPEYPEIYKQYSHYIHPSKEGNILAKVYGDDIEVAKEVKHSLRTIKRTKAEWDLIKLNQFIVDLMLLIMERNKKLILEDENKTRLYYDRLNDYVDSIPSDFYMPRKKKSQPN